MNGTEGFIAQILAQTDLIAVDVGASHFLPTNFYPLERAVTLCLFEPYEPAAEELRQKYAQLGLTNVKIFGDALADSNGTRILHVTNTPSSSSLLRPKPREYFANPDYVYPIKEVPVRVRRLADVLDEAGLPRADALKIDTQGAELLVLTGLGERFSRDTLAVELEIGFPGSYIDQPGFAAIDTFFIAAGFELIDLRPVRHHRPVNGDGNHYPVRVFNVAPDSHSLSKRIDEADALYFRPADAILAMRDAACVRRALVMYCTYGFFPEAMALLERAKRADQFTAEEASACDRAIRDWHDIGSDLIADSQWFGRLSLFMKSGFRRVQQRLLGKRFWRWIE
jgi:FkbM family methyltransferase